MADIQDAHETPGIKLFGATIEVQGSQAQAHDQPNRAHQNSQIIEKSLDKIIPCPRCKSTETKFCYFNNYNVNQPRHYCKGCQRYWTAGGALRNVPVGAGRRKTKPPCGELGGFSEGFLFDGSGVNQVEFDGVVEEWHMARHGGLQHAFQAKRQRNASGGQTF